MDNTVLLVWSGLGAAAGTLLVAALVLWTGRQVMRQALALWRELRGHQPALLAVVDEPTDPVIVRLAQLTGLAPEQWAAFLPAFLRAIADGLDRAQDTVTEANSDDV